MRRIYLAAGLLACFHAGSANAGAAGLADRSRNTLEERPPIATALGPIHDALAAPLAGRSEALEALSTTYPASFHSPLALAAAAAALDRDGPQDVPRARALLARAGDPRFAELSASLQARTLAREGKFTDAIQITEPYLSLRGPGVALQSDALDWAITAGDMNRATALFQSLDGRIEEGRRKKAIAALADRLGSLNPADLQTAAAWALARYPGGVLEDKTLAALAAARLPDPRAAYDRETRWSRCERLAAAKRTAQALSECAALEEQSPAQRFTLVRWQRTEGALDAAEAALAALAAAQPATPGMRRSPDSPTPAELEYERYEILRARGERVAARAVLLTLAQTARGNEAASAQLTLYSQATETAEQQKWLRAYVENADHGKDWSLRALGFAMDEFSAGRVDNALAWAARLVRLGNPQDDLVHGALYLEARIQELRKQPAAAKILYTRLVRDDKYGYYGMLARRRLGGALPLPPLPVAASGDYFQPQPLSPAEAGDLLLICGFPDWAAAAYHEAGLPWRDKEALAIYLQGDYARASTLGRSGVSDPYGEPADRLSPLGWRLAYPPAFAGALALSGPREDPLLTLSLMRQESFFKHDVISHAGAIGLMQLMPATAAHVARLEGIAYEPGRLSEPDYNTRLGRRYFYDLLAAFGEPAFALAAYNAGPGRIPQWRQTLGSADLDLFIERIPLKETRSYVRRILLNWQEYRRIYGNFSGVQNAAKALENAPWAQPWPVAGAGVNAATDAEMPPAPAPLDSAIAAP